MSPMSSFVNIAAYKFVRLDELARRRNELRDFTRAAGLKGTILLSNEGINLFIAGTREGIDSFTKMLTGMPEFAKE